MFNRRIVIFGQVQPGNSHARLHNSGSLQPQQRTLGALQKVWATWGEGNFSVSWCQNLDFHHPVLIPPLRSQRVLLSAPRSHYCPCSCHRFCYYVLPVTTAGIVSELLLLYCFLLQEMVLLLTQSGEEPRSHPWLLSFSWTLHLIHKESLLDLPLSIQQNLPLSHNFSDNIWIHHYLLPRIL